MQGGAISYAAAVATAFGVKACIVTAASSDANLTVFEGHELHIVSTQDTLTFEHTYTWWGELRFTVQACRCHGNELGRVVLSSHKPQFLLLSDNDAQPTHMQQLLEHCWGQHALPTCIADMRKTHASIPHRFTPGHSCHAHSWSRILTF